ncbi:unnamed protein product [Lactuca saligna]|uniref:Uncharacterized protein n=1 Tax=Lactuca saligna TaxID=75948 RepID=A0AA36EAM7_LACSI|nr:unnamed protein product [Lactuca saligna]
MAENHFNGVTNKDITINLLQTQLDMSLIRKDLQDQLRELRLGVNRDLDAMNREVDDVCVGQLDIFNILADFKNHFFSLQGSYVKMVVEHNKREYIGEGKEKSKKGASDKGHEVNDDSDDEVKDHL